MSYSELYAAAITGLEKHGIQAFTETYTGAEAEDERIAADGLVLRAPALEDESGLLSYEAFVHLINDMLKGCATNAVVMRRFDKSLEVYSYYWDEPDLLRQMGPSDLCCWIDNEPANFKLEDTSGVCPSAWYNGWDCDGEDVMPRRLHFLHLLATAEVMPIEAFMKLKV